MVERSGGRARGRALRDLWMTTTAMATGFAICGLAPTSALADCAATGSIIECTGTTSSPGYGDGTQNNQTITVGAGATVLGGSGVAPANNAAIYVGSGNNVNNGGSVTGGIDAIASTGDILVNNTASITANGGKAINSGGSATVNTTGSLSGQIGVQAVGRARVVNSGSISGPANGTFEGIKADSVELVNSGSISTGFVGVNAGAGGASIINQGTIAVTESLSAAISSNGGLALDNSGNIIGSVSTLVGSSSVANTGSIDGRSNIAIYTAGRLNLNSTGQISSSGQNISTVGADSIILTNTGKIVATGSGGSAVTAYTDLSGTNGGQIIGGNDGVGVRAFRDLTLTNTGNIASGNTTNANTKAVAVDAGNNLVLTNKGNIQTGSSGANIAVRAGASAVIDNQALISASGAESYGLFSGGDVRLANTGNIQAVGGGATGVYGGGSVEVVNRSSISADGTALSAKYQLTVDNSSQITSGGTGLLSGSDTVLNNSGVIAAPVGVAARAVAKVTNSGRIGSGGEGSIGIIATNAVQVNNSGTITGETGILVTHGGQSSTITNSGRIIGTGGTAIRLTNAADTVTLTKSSRVQGLIALGGGGDTVNVETSKASGSQVIVFDTLEGANVNLSGDRPATVIGNRIVAVDTTNFIIADSALNDVTGAVSNLVQRRNGNATSNQPADTTRGFWVQGVGGGRNQQTTSSLNGSRHTFGGLIAGYETAPFLDYRIGAFAGASYGYTKVNNTADNSGGTYAYAGIYGRYQPGAFFVDFNVVGGYAVHASSRNVSSNMAAGGTENASSRTSGVYVSPQVGLGYRIQYDQSGTITPAVKVRYLTARYGANTESGTSAPISVGARASHSLEVRGEVEMSRVRRSANGTSLRMYQTIGVVNQTRLTNGVVNANILGTQINLTTPGPRSEFAAYFGAGIEWTAGRGATLFANFEAEVRLDKSIAGHGRAGAMWSF